MRVEEVRYECKVEFWVSSYQRRRGEEFAAVELVSVRENLFGTLVQVTGLQGGAVAEGWGQLVEKDGVVFAVFDVVGEILDAVLLLKG